VPCAKPVTVCSVRGRAHDASEITIAAMSSAVAERWIGTATA